MELGALWLVIAALLIIAFFAWLFWFRLTRSPYEPDASIDAISPASLGESLRKNLSGADGDSANQVVWADVGEEVLVHLDSLAIEVHPGLIVATLDLESDQTGRETMSVPFAVGDSREDGTMIAVTEELPTGHPGLAARWGPSIQAALWAGILDEARDRAGVAGGVPGRIWVEGSDVLFEASTPPEPVRSWPASTEGSR